MRKVRSINSAFETREQDNIKSIEGYFARFNSVYQISEDMSESIAPGAFKDTLADDIRALIDHETMYVLGRTTTGTLTLREDEKGLYGIIAINQEDQDALNLWHRVKRGDVSQCSFGFDILDEDPAIKQNGSVHWTIKRVKLYEVSVCTFPAYDETSVKARSADLAEIIKRNRNDKNDAAWKKEMRDKLAKANGKRA